MSRITWDAPGDRVFETGVDQGVLYIPDNTGAYENGVAWNGLTSVTESPSGAEASAQYADNVKYLNLYSAEDFAATLEAFTWPDEFNVFDGSAEIAPGVLAGQQTRRPFGLSYRTIKGNDLLGNDYGYKLHLVYGCQASPSEKAFSTVNDTPEAIAFSWALTTTPVPVPNKKPSAIITIDSTMVDPGRLAILEQVLYGSTGVNPKLPLPASIIAYMESDATLVTPVKPAFNDATNTITITTETGMYYTIGGIEVPAGAVVIEEDTIVTVHAEDGYVFPAITDVDWLYEYTP